MMHEWHIALFHTQRPSCKDELWSKGNVCSSEFRVRGGGIAVLGGGVSD